MNGYGSRKFLLAISGLVIGSVLLWFGKLDGTQFVALNGILGGAYMAANAYIEGRYTLNGGSNGK